MWFSGARASAVRTGLLPGTESPEHPRCLSCRAHAPHRPEYSEWHWQRPLFSPQRGSNLVSKARCRGPNSCFCPAGIATNVSMKYTKVNTRQKSQTSCSALPCPSYRRGHKGRGPVSCPGFFQSLPPHGGTVSHHHGDKHPHPEGHLPPALTAVASSALQGWS